MRKNVCRALLLLSAVFLFLPASGEAACNITCTNGSCLTGESPATCCCDFSGFPHCGTLDNYPCQSGWDGGLKLASSEPTLEGFLAYLAENPEPAVAQ
jgi:hypothetical protein